MKYESTARYPAPSSVVIKMFTDPGFHMRKLEALGISKYQVLAHHNDGNAFSIRMERKVPVEAPGMVRKLAPMETTVVNEEAWDIASRSGSMKVEPQGMPLEMSCRTALEDEGDGCVVRFDWDINAKLPVMGATLEKFVIADMEKRAVEETRVAIGMLDAYR